MNDVERANIMSVIVEDQPDHIFQMTAEEMEVDRERFIGETAFSKTINTVDGRAMIIDGELIYIVSRRPAFHTDAICRALRRGGSELKVIGKIS